MSKFVVFVYYLEVLSNVFIFWWLFYWVWFLCLIYYLFYTHSLKLYPNRFYSSVNVKSTFLDFIELLSMLCYTNMSAPPLMWSNLPGLIRSKSSKESYCYFTRSPQFYDSKILSFASSTPKLSFELFSRGTMKRSWGG